MKRTHCKEQIESDYSKERTKRSKVDRGREKRKRQRRFERDQRAASKERHNSKTKGRGLTVLGKDDRFLRPKDLRKLKDAPDEMQYRDS